MVLIRLVAREGEDDDIYLGEHEFAITPRPGEHILIYRDGKPTQLTMVQLFHYPLPGTGADPEGPVRTGAFTNAFVRFD